jgi:hypothetical protein
MTCAAVDAPPATIAPTTAKAVKDGKEWLLVIDSHGKVLQ